MARQEHGPAHVHVHKAGGFARVWLNDEQRPPTVWDATNMKAGDVKAALKLMPITKPVFGQYRELVERDYPHLVV